MSWQATNWVIEKSKHKGSALLTMLMIANCANEDGSDAFPGLPRLAKDTRLSVRQVGRIIEALEKSGELLVRRSEGKGNHYAFPGMTPDKLAVVKISKAADNSRPATPDKSAPTTDILTVTPDKAMASDPSLLDPSFEPPSKDPPELEPPFKSPEFLEALGDWEQHKKEIRKPVKPTGRKKLYKELAKMGERRAIIAIDYSIAKGWQGVYEPKENFNDPRKTQGNRSESGDDFSYSSKHIVS